MKTEEFLTIEVTAADIKEGKPHWPACCPIAKAARRQGLEFVRVSHSTIGFTRRQSDDRETWALPAIAQKFIQNFDKCQPVEPISFKLEFHG